MNLIELQRALGQLRLGGMATVLETRLKQAQAESMPPIDLISCLISDELTRRSDRLLERRRKHAGFRDVQKTLDNFDFAFNPKMNRSLVFDLATGTFITRREDATPRFSKAIGCCIAKHMSCSNNSLTPLWTERASSIWNRSHRLRC